MNDEDFANLVTSIKQAGQIKRGQLKPGRVFEFSPLDIKRIRGNLHQSQREFAYMIGVSVSTLQKWELGQRKPAGPARALLQIAARNPKVVKLVLSSK